MSDDAGGRPKVPGRESERQELPRRFYKETSFAERNGGYAVLLDGRQMRTPHKAPFLVPTPALAQAIVSEWAAQGKRISPVSMPLTRIANSAIDGVAGAMEAVRDDIVAYAATDALCYRADAPKKALAKRQSAAWDPVLDWARTELGARFVLTEGVMPVEQPPGPGSRIRAALTGYDAFALAALHVMTTLTGSAVLALACARGQLTAEAAWRAAHVDEDWQIEHWGADAEAEARREARWREMRAACWMIELVQPRHDPRQPDQPSSFHRSRTTDQK